jgi:hypothetical protein
MLTLERVNDVEFPGVIASEFDGETWTHEFFNKRDDLVIWGSRNGHEITAAEADALFNDWGKS